MHRYKAFSAAMPTTSEMGFQATPTTSGQVKTYLQLATPSNRQLTVISWGYSFSSGVGALQAELVQTNVGATVTAHVASGLMPLDPNAPASLLSLGTANTGYNATAEGSITSTRVFDSNTQQGASGTAVEPYQYQFMPDERPILGVSSFLRVRIAVYATTSINVLAWCVWDE